MRTLWVCTTVDACNKQRCSCTSPMPVAIERRDCGEVLLFEDVVQPPRFAEERVRLCDLSLLVGITVYLECRLRGRALGIEGKTRKERTIRRGTRTSPYSFVSQMSKSGRRPPSCSLQRTTGCIAPDAPLKKTEALGSRFAALVFRD